MYVYKWNILKFLKMYALLEKRPTKTTTTGKTEYDCKNAFVTTSRFPASSGM